MKDNMTPPYRAQRKKKRLMRLLADIQRNKTALIKAVNGLRIKYEKGIISNDAYLIRRDALLGTRTIDEWINIYNNHSKDCLDSIEHLEKHIASHKERWEKMKISPALPYILLTAIVIMIGFFMIKPALIGFVTMPIGINASDPINITFSEPTNITWTPTMQGKMQSIRISGMASIEGSTVVSIIKDNASYVIFNSTMVLAGEGIGSITGYSDFGNETGVAAEPIILAEGDIPEDLIFNMTYGYKSGTEYDPEDNGQESTGGFIDLTIENTSTDMNESHLCTIWNINGKYQECYGSGLCCDFVETTRFDEDWKKSFLVYYGLNRTELENNISVQTWYVDYNLSTENPYSYIYSGEKMMLPANFYYRGFVFKDACIDTCLISDQGFDKADYTLQIDVDGGQLEISTIDYYIVGEKITYIPLSDITNETIVQHRAEINKPVKWTKKTTLSEFIGNASLNLTSRAENITIFKLTNGQKEEVKNVKIRLNKTQKGLNTYNLEKELKKIEDKIAKKIDNVKDEKGEVIICETKKNRTKSVPWKTVEKQLKKGNHIGPCGEKEEELTALISESMTLRSELETLNDTEASDYPNTDYSNIIIPEEVQEIEIEYYTPGPTTIESDIAPTAKKIVVTSEEHYTKIFTYTNLPAEAKANAVHLFWIINGSRIEITNIKKIDSNTNGYIDKIEWTTPHLSNQTYVVETSLNRVNATFFERSPDTCDATEYAMTDDEQYTYCKIGQYDWWTGYDFSDIPDNANITGIMIEIIDTYAKAGKDSYADIRLSWDDKTSWTSNKTTVRINETDIPGGNYSLGNSTETWGHNWTANEIKNHFWIELKSTGNPGGRLYLDWMPVTIYYTESVPIPSSVQNLTAPLTDTTWIYWNWTNPIEETYSHNIIYIDGEWKQNTSNNYYNATNLTAYENYTITVHTADSYGYVNEDDANNTAISTDAEPPVYESIKAAPTTYLASPSSCTDSINAYDDNAQYAMCNKDRYDWWNGYAFTGLPDNAAIKGIEIELNDAHSDSEKISFANISLSWNNRTSWTTPKQSLQIIDTTPPGRNYTFGRSNDTWGHNWTIDELKNNFWVEWETTGDQAGKVYADWLPARAYYMYIPQLGTVKNLNNIEKGKTWLYWNWTNPDYINFSEAIIYLDGTNIANTSNNYYNTTGLMPYTTHTITIHTKDTEGNLNTQDVSSTAITRKTVYAYYNATRISPTTFNESPSRCDASRYAYDYDDIYAFCRNNDYNWWDGYNFSDLPDNAIIEGIAVELFDTYRVEGKISNAEVKLSWNNKSNWTTAKGQMINETAIPGGDYIFGNGTDTWGHNWTSSEIKDNLWVEWKTTGDSGGKIYLDWMPLTVYYKLPTLLPIVEKFTHPDTTNFSLVPDIGSVENMTLRVENTKVTWLNLVNASDEDYDDFINMDHGFVSLDANSLHPSINSTANITMINIDCSDFELYYASDFQASRFDLIRYGTIVADESNLNGNCTDSSICTNLYCSNNTLNFIAQHFDGFGAGVIKWTNSTSPTGFGNNVTIDVDIEPGNYTIDSVFAGIIPPGGNETNYSMTNISSRVYVLDDYTNYINGTYNYKVYVNDTQGGLTWENGTFNMWLNLTIDVMTTKDKYYADEIVNLTSY